MYKKRRAAGDFGQQIEIRKLKEVADRFFSVSHFDFDLAADATPVATPEADTAYTHACTSPPHTSSPGGASRAPPAIASTEAVTSPPAIASAEAVTGATPTPASAEAITGSYRM
jgi:hypothetical protein